MRPSSQTPTDHRAEFTPPAPTGVFLCLNGTFHMTKPTLPWTRQGRFLRTLAKTCNVAEACRAAGLDRRLAYRWRDRDADFARRWKEAAARATDLLHDELMERALQGRERIVYRYRPTAAHRLVRQEIFGSLAPNSDPGESGPAECDLAKRLREAEVRVACYHAAIGVTFSDTHSEK